MCMFKKLQSIERRQVTLLQFVLLVVALMILGYFISQGLWNTITLPFSNLYLASGKLAQIGFNPTNNLLRWVVFVIFPSVVFLIFYSIFGKSLFIKNPVNNESRSLGKYIAAVIVLMVLVPCLVFVGKDLTTANFDIFHEGEQITPALNYLTSGGIWNRTLFVHGALYDVFTAFIGWKLFGVNSIGAYRMALDLFKLLVPFSLVLVLLSVWHVMKKTQIAGLAVILMALFYLGTWRIQNIDRREAPLLLGLSLLLWAFSKRNRLLYFCSGLLSAVSFFYSVDTGVYYTVLLMVFPIIVAAFKVHTSKEILHDIIYIYTGVVLGFLLFYILVGHVEFLAFISNLLYFTRTKDLIDSFVYPFPNIITSFRFTLPLLISALNLLVYVILFLFLYLKNPEAKNMGIVHTTLTFISLLHYRSALGRVDLTHIEVNSGLIFLLLGFNAALITMLFFPHKFGKTVIKVSVMLIVILSVYMARQIPPSNLFTFVSRAKVFLHEDSLSYVNKDRVEGIRELRQIFSKEKCVLSLTSEAAMPYLLNKPSCGPLYISYFASAEPVRSRFLDDIKAYRPKYLLFSTKSWTQDMDGISNEYRFPGVMKYVENNYSFYKLVADYWVVYALK